MQELINIIVNLLSKHTCVIVPGFGGFVINDKYAVVSMNGDHFSPPRKELIFNTHLSHNDGLLAHALMQEKKISFDEAGKIIDETVRFVKNELSIHKIYSLGDFGFFSLKKGNILFHAKNIEIENFDAFGLKEFYFPAIHYRKAKSGQSIPFPTQRNGYFSPLPRIIMGGMTATLALFLLCQPIKNGGATDFASLVPPPGASVTAPPPVPSTPPDSSSNPNSDLKVKKKTQKNRTKKDNAKIKKADYYMVVDEFESAKRAKSFIRLTKVHPGDSLHLLETNGKIYVTLSSPSDTLNVLERISNFRTRYVIFPKAFMLRL